MGQNSGVSSVPGHASPRISVVTVLKNAEKHIERAVLSVLAQDYDNIEYIVYDGASTDGSRQVLERYRDRLALLVIEEDDGPADALSKAFSKATGDIFCWINADDYYLPGTFKKIAAAFCSHPRADLIYGNYFVKRGDRYDLKYKLPFDYEIAAHRYLMIAQPSAFWRAEAYRSCGGVDRSLHFCFDFELFLRMTRTAEREQVLYVNDAFAVFEIHQGSKTGGGDAHFKEERQLIRRKLEIERQGIHKRVRKAWLTLRLAGLMVTTHGWVKSLRRLSERKLPPPSCAPAVHPTSVGP